MESQSEIVPKKNNLKKRARVSLRKKIGIGVLGVVALDTIVGGVHQSEPINPHVNIPGVTQTRDTGPEVPGAPRDTYTFVADKDGFTFQEDKPLDSKRVIPQILENRKNVNSERVVGTLVGKLTSDNHTFIPSAGGTGWILDDGYVLTVAHVVDFQGLPDMEVIFIDGKAISAKTIAEDKGKDLALLKYETNDNKFNGTRVGNYQAGEPFMTMTLDPTKLKGGGAMNPLVLSQRAEDGSRERIAQRLAPRETSGKVLSIMRGAWRAIFTTQGSVKPSAIDVVGPGGMKLKQAAPSTSFNIARIGMSGSAYFDEGGYLVGILSQQIPHYRPIDRDLNAILKKGVLPVTSGVVPSEEIVSFLKETQKIIPQNNP